MTQKVGRFRPRLTSFLAILILLVFFFPLIWMLVTSIKPHDLIYSSNPFDFSHLTMDNYFKVLHDTSFIRWIINSFIVAVVSTFISLVVSIFAAYSFIKFDFPGKDSIWKGILICYLLPTSLLFIPLYTFITKLGLFDTYFALILVYPSFLAPFCTWLLYGYFKSIPSEIEEVALLEGCTYTQCILRIVIPVAIPGIISTGVLALTLAWGEYIYALVFINTNLLKTLPVGVASLEAGDVYSWGPIMAAAILSCIPPTIAYLTVQRFFLKTNIFLSLGR